MIDAPTPAAPSASPSFPPLNLVYNAKLPDPFTMYNGFKITAQRQWQLRRAAFSIPEPIRFTPGTIGGMLRRGLGDLVG
jgi:hypothetical protein